MKIKKVLLVGGLIIPIFAIFLSYGLSVRHSGKVAIHKTQANAAISGIVSLSPKPMIAGQPITLTVNDADLITGPTTTQVTVSNLTTGQNTTVTLAETGTNTGVFSGTLQTTNASGVGTSGFNVQSGQSVQVSYFDANNASNTNSTVTDSTTVIAPSAISTVSGLSSTFINSSSVRLNWTASTDTTVKGYKVYFGTNSRSSATFTRYSSPSAQGFSPIPIAGIATTTATLSKLPAAVLPATLPAVTNLSLSPFNQGIGLAWSAVSGATGYKIYYSSSAFDSSTLPTNPISVTGTSYNLTGLTNGSKYFIAVTAFTQPRYYFAVTAAIDPNLSTSTPGSANESSYSTEVSQIMNSNSLENTSVSPQSAIPEVIVAYPSLKNEGCFIATAAYGFYSAPQVQVLRDFRDRYLLTNAPGRAFVAWYYRHGPNGARFLNQHPIFKPLVRVALLPLVAGAFFLMTTPVSVKIGVLLCLIISSTYVVLRKKFTLSGGVQ
jgi:hypothetical protein